MSKAEKNSQSKTKGAVARTAVIITVLTVLQKVIGFLRESILAYFYGRRIEVDAYSMASSGAEVILGFVTAFSVIYIPLYANACAKESKEGGDRFTNRIITLVMLIGVPCSLLCMLFSPQLVHFIAPGYTGRTYEMTVYFLRITVWTMTLNCIIQILIGYLNYWEKYTLSTASGMVNSVVQIIIISVSVYVGNWFLGFSGVFAMAVNLVVLAVIALKNGYRYRPQSVLHDEMKQVLLMVMPVFATDILSQLNLMIDKRFASALDAGSVSSLHYAGTVRSLFINIFTAAITTMVFPILSKQAAQDDNKAVAETTVTGVNLVLIIFVPLTAGIILLSKQVIGFIFEGGAFDSASTRVTAVVCSCYCISLVGSAVRGFMRRVLYAIKYSRKIIIISIVTIVVNCIANYLLVGRYGVNGLACATSISVFSTLPVTILILKRRLPDLKFTSSLVLLLKTLVCTAVMSLFVYGCNKWLFAIWPSGRVFLLLYILLVAGFGAAIYFLLLWLSKVKEISVLVKSIKRR